MNRNTNLRDMDAPPVGSGQNADETKLKATASRSPVENAPNVLKEHKTPAQPKGSLGGKNAFR
jgi:hypothetical protein